MSESVQGPGGELRQNARFAPTDDINWALCKSRQWPYQGLQVFRLNCLGSKVRVKN